MRINYNVTGADRKALVRAMVELLGKPPVYQGAPSFAYAVGGYQVSKDGMVSCPEDTSTEDIRKLVDALREKGFQPVEPAELPTAAADAGESDPAQADDEDLRFLIIKVPRDGFTLETEENLRRIIASKAPLLKKALETDSLELVFTDNAIRFQWFTLHGIDGEADAYNRLVTAICKMAQEQKRVVAKECASDNEKFAMRLFLIRLGFIGGEYKTARKILMRNLTGNSSWRSGHRPELADTAAETSADEKGGAPYEP